MSYTYYNLSLPVQQQTWESKKPVGEMHWLSLPDNLKDITFSKMTSPERPFFLSSKTSGLGYMAGNKYTKPRVNVYNELAAKHINSTWDSVAEEMNYQQPKAGHGCTLAVINPFTDTLQWMTVACDRKYNMSTLICETNRAPGVMVSSVVIF